MPAHRFTITYLAVFAKQLQDLLAAATVQADVMSEALRYIVGRLREDPVEWGDPEYQLKKEGGLVCHGIRDPFIVRFVIYQV